MVTTTMLGTLTLLCTTAVAFTPGKLAPQSTQSSRRTSSASMQWYHHEAPPSKVVPKVEKVVPTSARLALSKPKAETKEVALPLDGPESEAVGTFPDVGASSDGEAIDQHMESAPDGKYDVLILPDGFLGVNTPGDHSSDPLGLAPEDPTE